MRNNKWIQRGKRLSVFFLIVPLLSGCWDRLEIEERATILGIAIDTAGPEAEKEEDNIAHTEKGLPAPEEQMLRLTVQVAVPGRLPLGPQQGGGTGKPQQKPVWVLEVVGHTLEDAISNLQQQVEFDVFLGHLRLIAISEEIARKGVKELSDFLRRNPDVRRAAWMIVTKGKASKLMEEEPALEPIPTLYYITTLDEAVRMGLFPNQFIGRFWSTLSAKGQEPYLPYVEIKKKGNIEIAGIAYFRGDRMVGVTEPLEIGFFMAMMEMNPGGYTGLIKIPGKPGTIMFESVQRKSRITVDIKNGRPKITVKVHVEMDLRAKSSPKMQINKPDIIKKIQNQIEKGSEKGFKRLIKKTQKKRSDIFGFGEHVRAKKPKFWNQNIKTKQEWRKMYKEIPVDVHVSVSMRRIGMKAR